jgi:hypothetical protein
MYGTVIMLIMCHVLLSLLFMLPATVLAETPVCSSTQKLLEIVLQLTGSNAGHNWQLYKQGDGSPIENSDPADSFSICLDAGSYCLHIELLLLKLQIWSKFFLMETKFMKMDL